MARTGSACIIAFLTCAVLLVCTQQTHSHLPEPDERALSHRTRFKRQFNNGPFRGHKIKVEGFDFSDPYFYYPASPPEAIRNWIEKRQVAVGQNELIFSNNGQTQPTSTQSPPSSTREPGLWVLINNRPKQATIPPFTDPTTPSAEYMRCLGNCQTTNQYNPVCASNRQLYFNVERFKCARQCGADIEIVKKASCEGLFPMERG